MEREREGVAARGKGECGGTAIAGGEEVADE
jgi:hypothetical protein